MKTDKTRTSVADISVAGRELDEEHLRLVSGGALTIWTRPTYYPTASKKGGWVRDQD